MLRKYFFSKNIERLYLVYNVALYYLLYLLLEPVRGNQPKCPLVFFLLVKITAVPTAGLLIERVFVIWLVFRYPAVSSHETATKVKLLIPAVKHNQRYFWTPRTGFVRCLGRFLGQPAVFWLRWFPRTGSYLYTH